MNPKAETIVAQLCALTHSWNQTDDVPQNQQKEARLLGEELDRIGGYSLMLEVYDVVHAQNPCACVLQAYWDNVGTWRW